MRTSLTLDVYPGAGTVPAGAVSSVAAARDAIRRHRTAGGGLPGAVTVRIHAGVDELTEPLMFGPEDSGTAECPIRYVAADGAAPVISGGRRLTEWQETRHNGLRCWVAELPEVAAGHWNFTRLYVNRQARPRPRLPKTGFHRFSGLAGFNDTGMSWHQGPDRANFVPGDIQRWRNLDDVEVISYQLWFDTHHRIAALDTENQVVHFRNRSLGSLRDERNEFARYFVENVFEALDTPGEWYLDRPTGRLYYLPLPDESLADTRIVAPRLQQVLILQGCDGRRVRHLQFENLTFAYQQWELPAGWAGFMQAAYGVPGAIILSGAESCVVYGCTVEHVNGYGIEVLAGSSENVVARCGFHDTGAGGIKIGHEEIRRDDVTVSALTPVPPSGGEVPAMATTVVDCMVRDFGRVYPSAIGIWIGNSGWNRLLHNEIFDGNYTGISCGWTWGYAPTRTIANRIEANHIHHINHRAILSDNGGIYLLGIQPGTVLRGNVIHDISCYGYGGWGIYPDEGSSEILIENNLVYHTLKASFFVHYGRDLLVRHNIFALSADDHLSLGKREMHRSATFAGNLVCPGHGRIGGTEYLKSWSPAHYTLHDNLYWPQDGTALAFNGLTLAQQQAEGQNLGAVIADPLLADPDGGDFAVRPDSPAFGIGFQAFDWSAAGPRSQGQRPRTYADYLASHPLPPADVPVVRTRIELVTPAHAVGLAETMEYAVTLSNAGRAPARGAVSLAAGPAGAVKTPLHRMIPFHLDPGAELREQVAVEVRLDAPEFWLESSGTGDAVIGARKLTLRDACWRAPRMDETSEPATVAERLAREPAHVVARGDRRLAEIKLGATADHLLFDGVLHEPTLRPNLKEPWFGTGFELIVPQPLPAGAASNTQPSKKQVFLVPAVDGASLTALQLDPAGTGALPAPAVRAVAVPVAGGCRIAACIPWSLLGVPGTPESLPFELIIDVVNPRDDKINQVAAFDLPWDGWQRLTGRIVCE